jgi:hypothetical protein
LTDNLFIKIKRLSIDLFPKKFMNSMIEREKPDYDDIIVKHIVKLIKTNPTLNDKYFSATKNRKYSLENYLYVILNVLRTGIPWRFVDKFKITKDTH